MSMKAIRVEMSMILPGRICLQNLISSSICQVCERTLSPSTLGQKKLSSDLWNSLESCERVHHVQPLPAFQKT